MLLIELMQGGHHKPAPDEMQEFLTFEKGDFTTKITVTFNGKGQAVSIDADSRPTLDPVEEEVNHLQTKAKEYMNKGNWGAVAEIADEICKLNSTRPAEWQLKNQQR